MTAELGPPFGNFAIRFPASSRAGMAALAIAPVFALTVVLSQSAQAQTFKVIHTFTGGADGGGPAADLTMDRAGNLYGPATEGGGYGWGKVFKLSHRGSGWGFKPLDSFAGYKPWVFNSLGFTVLVCDLPQSLVKFVLVQLVHVFFNRPVSPYKGYEGDRCPDCEHYDDA
jgi:hypothetical protein